MDIAVDLSTRVQPAANKLVFYFTTTNLLILRRILRDLLISTLSFPNVGITTRAAKSRTVKIAIRAKITVEGIVSMKNHASLTETMFHSTLEMIGRADLRVKHTVKSSHHHSGKLTLEVFEPSHASYHPKMWDIRCSYAESQDDV